MTEQKCYNKYCLKVLSDEDGDFFCPIVAEKKMNFGEHHLCRKCFELFDTQKMNGRWWFIMKDMGVAEGDQPKYTESINQWIEWQGDEKPS